MVGDRDREEGGDNEEQGDERTWRIIVSRFEAVETLIRYLDNGQDLESGKRPK